MSQGADAPESRVDVAPLSACSRSASPAVHGRRSSAAMAAFERRSRAVGALLERRPGAVCAGSRALLRGAEPPALASREPLGIVPRSTGRPPRVADTRGSRGGCPGEAERRAARPCQPCSEREQCARNGGRRDCRGLPTPANCSQDSGESGQSKLGPRSDTSRTSHRPLPTFGASRGALARILQS